jgi:hypothetical protein
VHHYGNRYGLISQQVVAPERALTWIVFESRTVRSPGEPWRYTETRKVR